MAVQRGPRLCLKNARALTASVQGDSKAGAKDGGGKKKDEPAQELTPLEKMLQNAGPIRDDGSDKFFGLENVRITDPRANEESGGAACGCFLVSYMRRVDINSLTLWL